MAFSLFLATELDADIYDDEGDKYDGSNECPRGLV